MDALTWMKSSQEARLLITDNVSNGYRLIQRLKRKGTSVSGFTVTTSARIAKELLVRHLAATGTIRKVHEVTDDIGAFVERGRYERF